MKNKQHIDEVVKEALDNFEMDYDHSEWLRLEKELPKAKGWSPVKTVFTSIAGVAIIACVVLSYILINDTKTEKTLEAITTESPVIDIAPEETYKTDAIDNMIIEEQHIEANRNIDQKEDNIEEDFNTSITVTETLKEKIVDNSSEIVSEKSNKESAGTDKSFESDVADIPRRNNIPVSRFHVDIDEGCSPLTVNFYPVESADNIIYLWEFGDGQWSTEPQPEHIFTESGDFIVSLTVKYFESEKTGYTPLSEPIKVKMSPTADFKWTSELYTYSFENLSKNAYNWKWFIDGVENSNNEILRKDFYLNGTRDIKLTAYHLNGCSHSVTKSVDVEIISDVRFANSFIPNGGGINDYFGPIGNNLQDYIFSMQIYNRQGNLVFETNDPEIKWDGKIRNTDKLAKVGVYSYIVTLKDKYGNIDKRIGHVTLLDLQSE